MYRFFFKKALDIILCVIISPFFVIISLLITILIKLEDGGPIFYVASRIGKNGKLFNMYKFRSMSVDSQLILNSDGSTYNSPQDTRVTKVGKFIRQTSLDELPQICNVIKGDMSIIGPRASLASALSTYSTDEMDKMKVLPGITGYTQAYFRNDLSIREKRIKDAWYANNVNFILDMKIFFKTISTVLLQKGLYTNKR